MRKRCIEKAIEQLRHIQKNIDTGHYGAAWGQASSLRLLFECLLEKEKKDD